MIVSLRRSVALLSLLTTVHAISIITVIILPISMWAQILLSLLILSSLIFYLRKDALLLAPASTIAFKMEQDKTIEVKKYDGNWCNYKILGSSVVLGGFILLNLKSTENSHKKSLVIFFDAINKDDARRLRTTLRCGNIIQSKG